MASVRRDGSTLARVSVPSATVSGLFEMISRTTVPLPVAIRTLSRTCPAHTHRAFIGQRLSSSTLSGVTLGPPTRTDWLRRA